MSIIEPWKLWVEISLCGGELYNIYQFDQGEDRWLCTLLLQRGWRVEYSAASDSFTACPESFDEFYNQRRRWMPSTILNIWDLLQVVAVIIISTLKFVCL